MKSRITLVTAILLALALLMMMCYASQTRPPVQAAPAAVPTPIGALVTGGEYSMVPYFASEVITYSQASNSHLTARYSAADIHSVLDHTSTQTLTCKFQWSNDGTNWADGIALFTNKSADTNEITQTEMFGQRSRITCTVGTANPITVTIRAKVWK
jgi:hypothetical protein